MTRIHNMTRDLLLNDSPSALESYRVKTVTVRFSASVKCQGPLYAQQDNSSLRRGISVSAFTSPFSSSFREANLSHTYDTNNVDY